MRDNDINEIIPHLFVSNWDTSNNPTILKKYNIKAVITLETRPKPRETIDYYNRHGIANMYIYIGDVPNENIKKYFDQTYDFIRYHINRGENVLVHCWAGVSRSSTIALNYMTRYAYDNMNVGVCPCNLVKNVIEYSQRQRNVINPNYGFKNQLIQDAAEYRKKLNFTRTY